MAGRSEERTKRSMRPPSGTFIEPPPTISVSSPLHTLNFAGKPDGIRPSAFSKLPSTSANNCETVATACGEAIAHATDTQNIPNTIPAAAAVSGRHWIQADLFR